MRKSTRLAVGLTLVFLALPSIASAKEPPNTNDPCSATGRNTCGTNGVGFYTTYKYGLRWFGDYRGAVADAKQTFCIDLQYWYPSPKYRYRLVTADTLKNTEGELVPLENRRRMAYAMWAYGRSGDPTRQAAVMLYVHSLMGDARPGEVDPAGVRDSVATLYAQVARDAARYHGPYRVKISTPGRLRIGEQGTATIRVLSAKGFAVPNVQLALSATGAGVPSHASTGADGVASVTFTARTAEGTTFDVKTEPIASTLPLVYAPTTAAAAPNGQRLAAPASQVVTSSAGTKTFKARVRVSSVASPTTMLVGEKSHDKVTLAGADTNFKVIVTARIYGPFRTAGQIKCTGEPAWEGQWTTHGSGDYVTRGVALRKPGIYVYRHLVPGNPGHIGTATTCTDPRERVKVVAQPRVHTAVSDKRAAPGVEISDQIIVEGLGGETAKVRAVLYGPFPSVDAINCDGPAAWSGTVTAKGDGTYRTAAFELAAPGYYTYRESLVPSVFVRGAETACGEAAETSIAVGTPKVRTKVSDQKTAPGAQLTDNVIVTGIGELAVTVKVELFGPFLTHGGISCSGTPHWTGTFVADGDGTYITKPATIDRVGYYVYRESIAEAPQTNAFTGKCGVDAETSVARATPRVTTLVSDDVVAPGGLIHDRISVVGLGKSEARIGVELFGPFATRAAIRCTGKPYATGEVVAHGDGTVRTRSTQLKTAGFYTYREHLIGSPLIAETTTECSLAGETALARPLIITGRNDVTGSRHYAAADPLAPARVRISNLGIDAPVSPSGIDLKQGVLDVPADISRLGWWLDGQTPGSPSGSVLIAGHVDSARFGAGALVRLKDASRGDRIEVTTRNGRTFTYRVVSVQTVLKAQLPPSVYSRAGGPRLVLVTCGGPFDASIGHYRDNVIVTAVPVVGA